LTLRLPWETFAPIQFFLCIFVFELGPYLGQMDRQTVGQSRLIMQPIKTFA